MRRLPLTAALIALLAAALWWTGALERLGPLLEPQALRAAVAEAGPWGPALFIAALAAASALFLAGPVVWAGAQLWPWPLAFAYALAGVLLCSVAAYALSKLALRGERALPPLPARLRPYQAKLEARPLWASLALRVVFWVNPFVDLLLATTRVSTGAYLAGALLGLAPVTLLQVFVGRAGGALVGLFEVRDWALVGALVLAGGALYWARRRRLEETSG